MKAVLVRYLSADLSGVELAEIERPQGDILIRVRAASLNYPDLLMTQGKYQFKPDVPFVSGLEMAGEVVKAPKASGLKPGDKVRGGAKTGAFAEYAALPAASLRTIPAGLDFASAAAMGAAYQTAYVALVEIGRLQAGQTVLVHGASGGVGLAACDLARAMGAQVIAATHSADKLEQLHTIAKPHAAICNTGRFREDVAEITDGRLCDLVYDPIGGDVFAAAAPGRAAPRGAVFPPLRGGALDRPGAQRSRAVGRKCLFGESREPCSGAPAACWLPRTSRAPMADPG